jgi:hypothetical protein
LGREGEGLTAEEEAFVMAQAEARFCTALKESASVPRLEDMPARRGERELRDLANDRGKPGAAQALR